MSSSSQTNGIGNCKLEQQQHNQNEANGQQPAIGLGPRIGHQPNPRPQIVNNMVPCDICNHQFKTRHGMAIHKGKMHHSDAAATPAVNARKQKRKMLPVIVKTEPQMVHSEPQPPKKAAIPSENLNISNYGQTSSSNISPLALANNSQFVDDSGNDRPSTSSSSIRTPILPIPEDVEFLQIVKKKPVGRPRELVPYNPNGGLVQNMTASVEHSIGSLMNAAIRAQSTMIFEDLNLMQGTIGRIIVRFICNECRGENGIVRCAEGRACCVNCCGHPGCI